MAIPFSNADFSTTRRLCNAEPRIQHSPDDKFERMLFLPEHPQRKGEGGWRMQGYFKQNQNNQIGSIRPLITIITVVFNGASTIEKSILSVINQTYENVEYLIIDGGSTDGTVDIIRKYAHAIDYWVSEPDQGIYDAWNKAVRCANGDWICFIGADDYLWDDSILDKMASVMAGSTSDCTLVYGNIAVVNNDQQPIDHVGEPWEKAKGKLISGMSVPHPGLMHHRSWFEKYGLFDVSYRIAGDYEMLLRGWPKEDAFYMSDCIVVGMAQGGVSSTPGNSIMMLQETRRAQREHGIRRPTWRWVLALLRVYVRLVLQFTVGKRLSHRLLDLGRKIMRKSSYWTKL
jgi:hypothetical protein